jgi:hypothetical protein
VLEPAHAIDSGTKRDPNQFRDLHDVPIGGALALLRVYRFETSTEKSSEVEKATVKQSFTVAKAAQGKWLT